MPAAVIANPNDMPEQNVIGMIDTQIEDQFHTNAYDMATSIVERIFEDYDCQLNHPWVRDYVERHIFQRLFTLAAKAIKLEKPTPAAQLATQLLTQNPTKKRRHPRPNRGR
jgi:two-component SAPR family response regulator